VQFGDESGLVGLQAGREDGVEWHGCLQRSTADDLHHPALDAPMVALHQHSSRCRRIVGGILTAASPDLAP
jgi:hypothetical protein